MDLRVTHGHARVGHSSRVSPTYKSWDSMKSRCNHPSSPNWEIYGGKGINYDISWRVFENFLADMGERPEGMTLDRIDNDKDYNKDNCRWASYADQALNRGTNKNNTSGRKGVRWDRKARKWRVRVQRKGVIRDLYYGEYFEEACEIREAWEQDESAL